MVLGKSADQFFLTQPLLDKLRSCGNAIKFNGSVLLANYYTAGPIDFRRVRPVLSYFAPFKRLTIIPRRWPNNAIIWKPLIYCTGRPV